MPPSSPRPNYHHGDLKRTLISAALEAVERQGWEALSLSGLAEASSVAKSAPYRHFENRDALLAAVAAEAFELLIVDIVSAASTGDRPGALRAAAEAVLRFAERRPQLFRLMFRSDLLVRPGGPPDVLQEPARVAYLRFEAAVAERLSGADVATVKASTVAVWSMVFGFAVLTAEGRIKPFMREPLSIEELRVRALDIISGLVTETSR
ncbi:TetR/AcrR family transcriptional regulator [Singulisphaera rosea]